MKYYVLLLIILSAATYSASMYENLIDSFYQATVDEDYGAYLSYIDTSNWSQEDYDVMENMVEGVWQNYDTESYSISNFHYEVNGDYAMAVYNLESAITGYENINVNLTYVALFHNVGGSWKIAFNMPLADYLDFTDTMSYINSYKEVVDIETEKYAQPNNPGIILIDGEIPENLDYELEQDLKYCISNDYCINNGLGNACINNECLIAESPAQSEFEDSENEPQLSSGICMAFPLLLLFLFGFSAFKHFMCI